MNVAYTLGRIFIPIVFLVSGIQKVMNIGEIAQMLAANGVPIPDEIVPYLSYLGGIPKYEALGYLIAAIEIICGLMVLIGLKARWAALVLIVFTACTIIFVHHFWDMQGAELIQQPRRCPEKPVDHGRTFADRRGGGRSEHGGRPLNARRPAPRWHPEKERGRPCGRPKLIRHAGGTSGRVDLDATPPTRVTVNSNVAVDKD